MSGSNAARLARRLAQRVPCSWCGQPMKPRTGGGREFKFCSRDCKRLDRNARERATRQRPAPGSCALCGVILRHGGRAGRPRVYCSDRCKKILKSRSASGHRGYQKHSAEVFLRDGFTCGICDYPVRVDAEPNDPEAATLDHVVPRALGGSDGLENLQTAHRYCNIVKGSRLVTPDDKRNYRAQLDALRSLNTNLRALVTN